MWNQLWPTPVLNQLTNDGLTYLIYSHFCTHTGTRTVYTSLPFASSTSPRWLPVFASTWLVSGQTGRFQFPPMENTGGSTWTAQLPLSCLMVRQDRFSSVHYKHFFLAVMCYTRLFVLFLSSLKVKSALQICNREKSSLAVQYKVFWDICLSFVELTHEFLQILERTPSRLKRIRNWRVEYICVLFHAFERLVKYIIIIIIIRLLSMN